jgi:GNAT superfamily N-acetyltransferase
VVPARPSDLDGLLRLAAEVEDWFGPMAGDPQFHALLIRKIQRGTALVVRAANGTDVVGGLLTGGEPPNYRLDWLVVGVKARGHGVGHALVNYAIEGFRRPCRVDVVTFGEDHPAAIISRARAFYGNLGFWPGEVAPRGPEGGSRQWYHLTLPS